LLYHKSRTKILEKFFMTEQIVEAITEKLQAGVSPQAVALEFDIPLSRVFRLKSEVLPDAVENGHERPADVNDRFLQLLVPEAMNVFADIILDTKADAKARLTAAREVLDRRSYTGIQRKAVLSQLSLSDTTLAALKRAEETMFGSAPALELFTRAVETSNE
jgi:hypothetical protein